MRLEFTLADLTADEGWEAAVAGCRFVLHGASPTPSGSQVSEADWITPAIEGNLRVLRAARDARVQRVVLTSAFGAVGVGHPANYPRPFKETDWSDISGDVWPYQKSKTLAERAAWEFIQQQGDGMELSAINPVAVLGPVLGADYSHSTRIIKEMLEGQPGCPDIHSCFVDVRDVASLHLLAMTRPEASGERFLASAGRGLLLVEVARTLKQLPGEEASKVSVEVLTHDRVRAAAQTNPLMQGMVKLLGIDMSVSAQKASDLLGWQPRSPQEAIIATARSFIDLGLVANR